MKSVDFGNAGLMLSSDTGEKLRKQSAVVKKTNGDEGHVKCSLVLLDDEVEFEGMEEK